MTKPEHLNNQEMIGISRDLSCQENAEEIREKIMSLIEGKKALNNDIWNYIFSIREHVLAYFEVKGIEGKKWRSSEWLQKNGYVSFYYQSANKRGKQNKRFSLWDEFLIWMGEEVTEKTNWDEVFECSENVKKYLKDNRIEDKNWQSSNWLTKNGYVSFYQQAVSKKSKQGKRFESWNEFLIWMGEKIINWNELLKSPKNVKKYLEEENLLDENWQNCGWLINNGYGVFYRQAMECAIQERPERRFGSWNDFLIWMGEEVEKMTDWEEVFKSPENVRKYLREKGIEDKKWQNSKWLGRNGHRAFYKQAVQQTTKKRSNKRFESWNVFLTWMGEKINEKSDWDDVFLSPTNVRRYLKEEEIEDKKWRSSEWLQKNGYISFYQQVVQKINKKRPKPRFSSWYAFLVWMGEREAETQIPVSDEIIEEIRGMIKNEF